VATIYQESGTCEHTDAAFDVCGPHTLWTGTQCTLVHGPLVHGQWTGWRFVKNYLVGPADLTGADLTGADLTGADLTGADLTGADLTRADLTGADLTGADLTGADLTGADLTGADLTGADLTATGICLFSTDSTGDGTVDVLDLLGLLGQYGVAAVDEGSADTNNDGTVNVADLMNVLDDFGGGGELARSCTEFCPDGNVKDTLVNNVSTNALHGTTYRLSYNLAAWQQNIYAIYGDEEHQLSMPPSYQEAAPFGANSGGVNSAFIAIRVGAEFDGWLTVGITDGDHIGEISSIGVDFASWTVTTGLNVTDGAVFWMSPDDGPTDSAVLAQVTLQAGFGYFSGFTATMKVRGRSTGTGQDWCRKLTFTVDPPHRPADLTGADLTGADLRLANLTGANLTGADLTGADLTGADLTGADLTGANLTGADLTGANLTLADLTGADLTLADITGADLTGADLTGSTGICLFSTDNTYGETGYRSCTEICPADPSGTVVQVSTDGAGTTYRLSYTLRGVQKNIYAIYGDTDEKLSMPPSYQEAAPFGANVGGGNAAFFAIMAGAEFDGWLTVGITGGDTTGELGSIGVDFASWSGGTGLNVTDGAVFWMSPDDGPTDSAVLAQVTLSGPFTATMKVRGRSIVGQDWCRKLTFAG